MKKIESNNKSSMELIYAVRDGDFREVDRVLCESVDDNLVNFVDDNNKTAFIYACEQNNIDIVKILLMFDMNINDDYFERGRRDAKLEIVSLLNDGLSILSMTDGSGYIRLDTNNWIVIKKVVHEGFYAFLKGVQFSDINVQDINGNTLLYYAIKSKNPNMIRYFLENGASLDIENNEHIPMAVYLCKLSELFSNILIWSSFKLYLQNKISDTEWGDTLYWSEKEFNDELEHRMLMKQLLEKDMSGKIYKLPHPDSNGDTVLVENLVGKGGNGVVYHGYLYFENYNDRRIDVAIKMSYIYSHNGSRLSTEAVNYKVLQGNSGIPKCYNNNQVLFDTENNVSMIIVEYLDKTLSQYESIFYENANNVVNVLNQIIDLIGLAIKHQMIISDISPHNFMVKNDFLSTGQIYITDMGAVALALIPPQAIHVEQTPKYQSIESHNNPYHKFNVLDSLESAGYTAAELLCGGLPWSKIPDGVYDIDTRNEYISKTKESSSGTTLTCGSSIQIASFIDYVKSSPQNNTDEILITAKSFLQ